MEKVLIEIEMENGDVMKGELYPEVAPITVENFLKLIDEDFFAGLIFHRVIPGFMIQGGGYTKDFKEMETACSKALEQIKDRRYQEYLLNDDRRDILLYGIAFCKKRCKVIAEKMKI